MKRISRISFFVVLVFALVSFISCAKASTEKMGFGAVSASAPAEFKRESSVLKDVSSPPAPSALPLNANASAKAGRKLVYTADLSIEAKNMADVEKAIVTLIEKEGGYVASRTGDDSGIYLQFRLPAKSLEPVITEVAGTGKILSKSMNVQDVSDQFFDLEGRLRNKRILEERYREYLKSAKSIEDMLAVEQKLSETTNEIEWLEGSFRDLSKQIELSTLNVSIRNEYTVDPAAPGLVRSIGTLFASFGQVAGKALVVLIAILIYGIPLLACLALIWLLTFGRVGLVRKLFALVGKRNELL